MATAKSIPGETTMKRLPFLAIALLCSCFVIPAYAQNAMKKDAAPKPPDHPAKVVLDSWNDIGRKLIAMAEDFPEDKYDFKPTPAQRTFAQQLLHMAGANYYFTNPVTGEKGKVDENPSRDKYKTKADVVAYVKKSFADGAAAIKAKGDKGMNDLIVDPFAHQQVRVYDMAYGFIEHCGEHYGQLVVYYRLSGLVPPESRPKK
ncbi:MAG: DinB family protein [Candidatus Sulfotelmatobacter sp.]